MNDLKKENIQKSLNSQEYILRHHYVNNDKSTNLLYYKHCDIISEKLLESLKKIDKDINNKCQKVECVFDKNMIIIFINKSIINIAHFDNEIFVKQIIISNGKNNSYNLQQIFNLFAQRGYNEFMKIFVNSNNLINFNINLVNQQYNVQANIFNITDNGKLIDTSNNKTQITKYPLEIKDDDFFPPIPITINDSYQDFLSKPQIGLQNIGAYCYMNATLQCLCNIKILVDYFKYNNHLIRTVKGDNNKQLLCSSFKTVMEGIYDYKRSKNYENYLLSKGMTPTPNNNLKIDYAPRIFKDTISRMNPLFKGVQANHAKDLVDFILETLHTELNRPRKQNINEGNLLIDKRNKKMMFNIFINNFVQAIRSIISDLFFAMNCNITQCGNCNSISYYYQIYSYLEFYLEWVRKFRLSNPDLNPNSIYLPNNTVDIFDCFNYAKKIDVMEGDNAMYCEYCKQTCQSSLCTLLTTGPEILIIILNRGQEAQFDVKIIFPLELDLMHYIELQNTGCYYELIGVISHIGNNIGGHFIAFCKSYHQKDFNRWYKFNDSIVTPVNDFNKEVAQYGIPHVLFYKKKLNN